MNIVDWKGGPDVGPNVVFARQSLPPIVWNGKLNPALNDSSQWGATLGNAVRVWRTGVGIDRRGNVIYAAADYQTVVTLAQILRRAGAVRAMQFDINPEWPTLITLRPQRRPRPGQGRAERDAAVDALPRPGRSRLLRRVPTSPGAGHGANEVIHPQQPTLTVCAESRSVDFFRRQLVRANRCCPDTEALALRSR